MDVSGKLRFLFSSQSLKIDEEDQIIKENEDNKSKKSKVEKYDRKIKNGEFADQKYGFPNFFHSLKSRSKITREEEGKGLRILLGQEDKKTNKNVEQSEKGKKQKGKSKTRDDDENMSADSKENL